MRLDRYYLRRILSNLDLVGRSVSGANLENCLTAELRDGFPVRYKFGNQYLLSNLIDPKNALDLTPLTRDLQAPHDCDASPLPRNRYYRYE